MVEIQSADAMRAEARQNNTARLTSFGYSTDQAERLDEALTGGAGIILFVGGAGSGKSTVIMELAKRIVDGAGPIGESEPRHAKTEEPEGPLQRIMQSDPNWYMVTEIRSPCEAQSIFDIAKSGATVIAGVAATGPVTVFERLAEIGVARPLLADPSIRLLVVFQKLLHVLCPHCKTSATSEDPRFNSKHAGTLRRLTRYLDGDSLDGIYFRSDHGCTNCAGQGIVGRTLCASLLDRVPSMADAIIANKPDDVFAAWRREIDNLHPECMAGRTAQEHAVWKMQHGLLSPDDVERAFGSFDSFSPSTFVV